MVVRHLTPFRGRRHRAVLDPLRMLDDFFEDIGNNSELAPRTWTSADADFIPHLDVINGEKEIQVQAELPGLTEKDIDVSIENDVLTIKGEKKQEKEEKSEGYYRMERSYGTFHREVLLPADTVETDHVNASFKNGVLTVRVPKKAVKEKSTKKIDIKAE